ncbi:MAG: cytochrome C [Lutibacter sp.]|nr:MAG: cytochrome C [Lutibacter sp.]
MKRLFFIGIFALLVIATIVVWSKSYYAEQEEAYVQLPVETGIALIPSEKGVFERSKFANDYATMRDDYKGGRSLESYYDNRAFHGAPPTIPHPIVNELTMGDRSCLKCHENGGYVAKFKAFTPVVPHPEKVNCRQCHVPIKTKSLFKATNSTGFPTPSINNEAFVGGPPIIPHQIQLHENCLACHAGPSAPVEIRVLHPERSNCRQCHVLNNKEMTDIGDFIR